MKNNEYNEARGAAGNELEHLGNTAFTPTGYGHIALQSLRCRVVFLKDTKDTSEYDLTASLS